MLSISEKISQKIRELMYEKNRRTDHVVSSGSLFIRLNTMLDEMDEYLDNKWNDYMQNKKRR